MGGSSCTTTTKVGCLLHILWLNQNARVENSTDTICTAMHITIMRAVFQWFEYCFQNLLINIPLEMSKFFGLGRCAAFRVWRVNNLCNMICFGMPASRKLLWKTHYQHISNKDSASISRCISNLAWEPCRTQDHRVLGHTSGNEALIKPEMERQITMWEIIRLR